MKTFLKYKLVLIMQTWKLINHWITSSTLVTFHMIMVVSFHSWLQQIRESWIIWQRFSRSRNCRSRKKCSVGHPNKHINQNKFDNVHLEGKNGFHWLSSLRYSTFTVHELLCLEYRFIYFQENRRFEIDHFASWYSPYWWDCYGKNLWNP